MVFSACDVSPEQDQPMSKLQYHAEPNGVVTLTLNRPEIHNAFDEELICMLTDTLDRLHNDTSVRVVVLTGNGESFSAGADLNWMRGMMAASQKDNERDARQLARLLRRLNYLNHPTVARVNGSAYGGGLGLIACCDIVVATDSARFALSECRLGLAPAVISPYVFRRIGETHARRYFLTGERFDAVHARRMGLVHDIVPDAELDILTERLVNDLLRSGPRAAGHCKKLVFHAGGHDQDSQLKLDQYTARLIAEIRTSAEGQEGMHAFLEKRKPGWQNDSE
jgi:methylglutaconyl-CoA hydratase